MKQEDSAASGCQEYFTKEHNMVRRAVKEFIDKEVKPFIDEWEEAGEFPIEIYKKAGDLGFLGTGYPEEYGGTPGDVFFQIVVGVSDSMSKKLMPRAPSAPVRTAHVSWSALLPLVIKVLLPFTT